MKGCRSYRIHVIRNIIGKIYDTTYSRKKFHADLLIWLDSRFEALNWQEACNEYLSDSGYAIKVSTLCIYKGMQ
jgi:hypothetical protein